MTEEKEPEEIEETEEPKKEVRRTPPPKPKRLAVRILVWGGGTFVLLLILGAILGPSMISSIAHGSVIAALEEQLDGKAELDSLDFSWSGHIDLAGLRFTDAKGEQVFSVEKVAMEVDVWAAIGGAYHFTADVTNPHVTVHRRADGTLNVQEMLKPSEPSTDPKPEVSGKIKVSGLAVTVIDAEDNRSEFTGGTLDSEIKSLHDPVSFTFALADPDLKAEGTVPMGEGEGETTIRFTNIALAKLSAAVSAFAPVKSLEGELLGEATLRFGDTMGGDGDITLTGFRMEDREGKKQPLEPINLLIRARSHGTEDFTADLDCDKITLEAMSIEGIKGKIGIKNLSAAAEGEFDIKTGKLKTTGENAMEMRGCTMKGRALISEDRSKTELRGVKFDSDFAAVALSCRIEGSTVRDLKGTLTYLPDNLAVLLNPWITQGRLHGNQWKKGTFDIRQIEMNDVMGSLAGEIEASAGIWEGFGLATEGKADFKQKDGVQTVEIDVKVNEGTVLGSATLQKSGNKATVKATSIKTRKGTEELLERLHPIFVDAPLAEADGQFDFDLDVAWKDSVTGTGAFAGTRLRVGTSPFVGELFKLIDLKSERVGTVPRFEYTIGDEKVTYKKMIIRMGKHDIVSSGWVGFDGTYRLEIQLPITDSIIKKHPTLLVLKGKKIRIPVEDKGDGASFDVAGAVKNLLKDSIKLPWDKR